MTLPAPGPDRTAVVTGASSGIGAEIARELARRGHQVTLVARSVGKLQALADEVTGNGGRAEVIGCDLSDRAARAGLLGQVSALGLTPDILVNNAGLARNGALLDLPEADWDAVIDTNLKGVWQVGNAVARGMRDRGTGGSIVNIASITGLRQSPGITPYAVSKAGVIQLTKQMALEWARHRIRVNAIAPGYVLTDINREWLDTEGGAAMIKRIPQRRLGELSDLTGPLLLLASSASAYMTGSVLTVDGGHLLSGL